MLVCRYASNYFDPEKKTISITKKRTAMVAATQPPPPLAPAASTKTSAEEEALKRNTDCVYFLASPLTCKKVRFSFSVDFRDLITRVSDLQFAFVYILIRFILGLELNLSENPSQFLDINCRSRSYRTICLSNVFLLNLCGQCSIGPVSIIFLVGFLF